MNVHSNMILRVLSRKSDDDSKMDGDNLKGDVVMEKENRVAVAKGSVAVPRRAYTTREDLHQFRLQSQVFWTCIGTQTSRETKVLGWDVA